MARLALCAIERGYYFPSPLGIILAISNSPGMAIKAQKMKNDSHPRYFTIKPVGAEAITLGTPIRLLKRAYWVAVKRLSVILAIKAT